MDMVDYTDGHGGLQMDMVDCTDGDGGLHRWTISICVVHHVDLCSPPYPSL